MRLAFIVTTLITVPAAADTKVVVNPVTARPGDAVLVTVTGAPEEPHGTADGAPLAFFRARAGYQAIFAVPLTTTASELAVEIDSAIKPVVVRVRKVAFRETDVVVEEEYANPPAPERHRIDADNKAIVDAVRKSVGAPQFTRAFRRPPGAVTSGYGVWRTFNDGHRSQHLGLDVAAREAAPVHAVNDGTVVLVRDGFLTGTVVVIAHGGGIASAYFHLSLASVAEGDVVARGAELGRAGHTGRTTGPHIHLAIHVPGGFVDPAEFLQLRIAPAAATSAAR